ncbi:MAG: sigma-70 family RNA polymerase sigma factor [Muribaculaceae bacterium]|nr:sigma-70 family RNA polymerase sigma factor [Muribaculaceae bacterium]
MLKLNKLTDDQLVAAYADGNNEAFDVLLNRHQSYIFSYIMRLIKDADMSNDIFQETFVKAIMNIRQGRYTGDGKFQAWLTRIAHNLIIDFFRQEKNVPTVSTDNEEVNVLNRRDLSEGTVEDAIIDCQIMDDVQSLVSALPDDQRKVVEMRYYQNMSFKEIAERSGVSINTALGRMRYAILNMRRRAKQADMVLVH